jgi:hypothetical protein
MKSRLEIYHSFLQEEILDKFLLKKDVRITGIRFEFKVGNCENLANKEVIGCINFLELFSGQKVGLYKNLTGYHHGKKKEDITLYVTIRKNRMWHCFDYLLIGVIPVILKQAKRYSGKIIKEGIYYKFNDLNAFRGVPSLTINNIRSQMLYVTINISGGVDFLHNKYYAAILGAPII